MGKLMRWSIGDSLNHESFFSIPVADEAVAGLFLFEIAGPAIAASMTPILDMLAMLMDSYVALRTVDNRVW